ncbi:MAG: helix-turn-helix domain-containing protein [Mycobacteriaceae bacterium]|nr:helix-turn-helix domain-containing protein [Mycobacteriaceae bacterium]MBV9638283.1 helix-turn-helix domain-containing protein [Mycobacteriaceae bacterium]
MEGARVGLGRLLLALDRTMVTLVAAPRGLDMPVASVALVDADDVRLGLAVGAGNADVFFLLGVGDVDAVAWIDRQVTARVPAAIFVKDPSDALVERVASAGAAVVAVEPRARWERLYRLVNHVFEHHGDRAERESASGTDLFGLAQSIAERTHAMISIEDAQSHVLAYSASNDEADELRRLSILGRAGPPEHLAWIAKWGIFDALRAGTGVVRVAERPELGLRPRLAVGIHRAGGDQRRSAFIGTIWLQQGSRPLADDVEQVLRGAAVLAARIMSRLAATPSTHALRVHELLGLSGEEVDVAAVARELGIVADGRAALVGLRCADGGVPADVIALSASAFRPDAQVIARGDRAYVLFPQTGTPSSVASWVRGTVASLRRELGLALRAVIAAPVAGLAAVAPARAEVDRVFDSAERHPGVIREITSLAEARTTVLLDEIVALVAGREPLVDPRLRALRDYDAGHDGSLIATLGAYLDCFGDVGAAARGLQVHPNTVRYRLRRIEKLLGTSLTDPDDRLVLALGLKAMSLIATRATPSAAIPRPRSARRSR